MTQSSDQASHGLPIQIGLCSACQHHRVIRSDSGAGYILCKLAKTDPGFAKYPRLPVLECPGFEGRDETWEK